MSTNYILLMWQKQSHAHQSVIWGDLRKLRPQVRLLDLIKGDRCGSWGWLMALKSQRLSIKEYCILWKT